MERRVESPCRRSSVQTGPCHGGGMLPPHFFPCRLKKRQRDDVRLPSRRSHCSISAVHPVRSRSLRRPLLPAQRQCRAVRLPRGSRPGHCGVAGRQSTRWCHSTTGPHFRSIRDQSGRGAIASYAARQATTRALEEASDIACDSSKCHLVHRLSYTSLVQSESCSNSRMTSCSIWMRSSFRSSLST